ncbi:pilin [Patescibacteria group bacterium]|nr:pilin [Patescibacteria group bacterium]
MKKKYFTFFIFLFPPEADKRSNTAQFATKSTYQYFVSLLRSSLLIAFFGAFVLTFSVQAVDLTEQVKGQLKAGAAKAEMGVALRPQVFITDLIMIALIVTGSLFIALVVYGGFLYVTSRGEEEKVKKGKNIITMAIIGLAIVLFSYSITMFIGTKLTGNKVSPSGAPSVKIDTF